MTLSDVEDESTEHRADIDAAEKYMSSEETETSDEDNLQPRKYGRRIQDIIDNGIYESVQKANLKNFKESDALFNSGKEIGKGSPGVECNLADLNIRGVKTPVAVKRAVYANDDERYYLEYEISVTGSLKHRNMAGLYYYSQQKASWLGQGGVFIMIMEYGGTTLKKFVKKDCPNGKASLIICEQTNRGLAYLHHYISDDKKYQIIHRDMKYDNVLVTMKRRKDEYQIIAKIIDFGIARDNYASESTNTNTMNDPRGAKPFISPEILYYDKDYIDPNLKKNEKKPIFSPKKYTPKMDIYGTGINFFYSFTERLPYDEGYTETAPFTKITNKTIPVLPEGTPIKLYNFLCEMLRFQHEKRPGADKVASTMRKFYEDKNTVEAIEKVWERREQIKGPFKGATRKTKKQTFFTPLTFFGSKNMSG